MFISVYYLDPILHIWVNHISGLIPHGDISYQNQTDQNRTYIYPYLSKNKN